MATLQVILNNKEVCKARHTGVGNVSFHITINNHLGEEKIDFEVSGMEEGNGKKKLLDWVIDQQVKVGDELTIKILNGTASDEPKYELDWSPY